MNTNDSSRIQEIAEKAIDQANFPDTAETASVLSSKLKAAVDSIGIELERNLPGDELSISLAGLSGIRTASHVLSCLCVKDRTSQAKRATTSSWTAYLAKLDCRDIAIRIMQGLIGVAIFWVLLATDFSSIVPAILFALFLVLGFLMRGAIASQGTALSNNTEGHHAVAIPLFDGSKLKTHLFETIRQADFILDRYCRVVKDLNKARSRMAISADNGAERLQPLQQMLGAARRDHKDLRNIVENFSLATIEESGMEVIHFKSGENNELFDVQSDIRKGIKEPQEIYPAVVVKETKRLELRGRVIMPDVQG